MFIIASYLLLWSHYKIGLQIDMLRVLDRNKLEKDSLNVSFTRWNNETRTYIKFINSGLSVLSADD